MIHLLKVRKLLDAIYLFLLFIPYYNKRIFLDKDDKKDLKSESHKKEKDKDDSIDKSNADEDVEDALEEGLYLIAETIYNRISIIEMTKK